MRNKLMLVALLMIVSVPGLQAQSGVKTGRYPTPTAGGTDATTDHGQKTEPTTNKPAMGAGSNTLTTAGSGKKSSGGQPSGNRRKGSQSTAGQVNQQAAGVPESGGGSGKRKNH